MTEEINFAQLKSAYYNLIKQYVRLLNKVSERKVDGVVRLLVEDHIRVKFQEIEKALQLTLHRWSAELDHEEISWMQSESDYCRESAAHLQNANAVLKTIWKVSWRAVLGVIIVAALVRFRELSSLEEVFLNLDMLTELVVSFLEYLVYGGVALVYCFVFVFLFVFDEKRSMFDPGYESTFGKAEEEEVINNSTPVYQLEDQLFQQFGRDKRPERKIDIPITVFLGSILIVFLLCYSRKYVEALFGEILTWVILSILVLGVLLVLLRYIRRALKREFD